MSFISALRAGALLRHALLPTAPFVQLRLYTSRAAAAARPSSALAAAQGAAQPRLQRAQRCCACRGCRQKELELEEAEEAALAARVEAAVQERVAAAMASEEVLARIARRLTEERAKLEERVGPPARNAALL